MENLKLTDKRRNILLISMLRTIYGKAENQKLRMKARHILRYIDQHFLKVFESKWKNENISYMIWSCKLR